MELHLSQIRAGKIEALEWKEEESPSLQRDMAELERHLCEYVEAEHCVCVDSATTGMLMALRTAGVQMGDSVLCTSFSYFATADIIELLGAKPVFVDINPNSYCIDPYCLEYVVGKCVRRKLSLPRALIAVDLFGLPCNYDAIAEICEKYGIVLIEDMAQSFGASYKGRKTGCFGRLAVSSFFPARPLGELGEGGAVFCHSCDDASRLESLRRNIHLNGARSNRLDTVQASVVEEKLRTFDLELERRRKIATRYRERLQGHVKLQQIQEHYESACTHFVISLKDARIREGMIERLQLCHIPCEIFTPSPISHRERSGNDKVALVNAQSVAQRILTIPMHPYLSGRVVDYICDRILEELASPGTALDDLMKAGVPETLEAEQA